MQSVVICQAEDLQLRGLYSLNLTNGTRKLVWQAEHISFVICRNSVVYLLDSKNEGKLVVLSKTFDKLFETQSYGLGPTHISIDQSGKFLAVTNFIGGSVAIFTLDSNGLPSKTLAVLTEVGSGKDNLLQTSSHPQSSVFLPSSAELLVANYGTDVVSFYEVSEEGVKFSRDRSMKYDGGIKNLCLGSGSGNTIVFIKEFEQKLSIVCLNEFKNVTARVLGLGPRTNGQLSLAVSPPFIFIGIEERNLMYKMRYDEQAPEIEREQLAFDTFPDLPGITDITVLDSANVATCCPKSGQVRLLSIDTDRVRCKLISDLHRPQKLAILGTK